MKIKTKITLKEYTWLNYQITYRMPAMLYLSVIGIVMIAGFITKMVTSHSFDLSTLPALLFAVVVTVLIPFMVQRSSKKHYKSNLRIQEEIEYDFEHETMRISGESFYAELNLNKSFKIIELAKWFAIYESVHTGHFIPKKNMSITEVRELRTILQNLKDVKLKKLKKV